MVIRTAEQLHDAIVKVLTAAGAGERHMKLVADHLVAANLSGVDTHGVTQMTRYVRDIKEGRIDPVIDVVVLRDADNHALMSGQWTFGHVAAYDAMSLAIEKAQAHGIAVVGLVEITHIGRVGHYVEMASREQVIGMVFGGGYCRSAPRTIPYGGRIGALDTNPIAMSFAGPDEDAPVMFDFATTTAAGGKVAVKGRRKEELPPGWIVDKDGNPSTRHEDFANGGYYMPFGLHKGYCLSMAAELLGSVFTGADSYVSSGPDYPMFDHQGVAIIAMRADLFQPLEQFRSSLEDRVQCIREVPPAPGYGKVLVPGDPERNTRIERSRDGIPFHEDDWQLFVKAAATVGCEID